MGDDLIAEDELKAALEEHAKLEPPKKRPCRDLLQKYASTIRKEINRGFTINEMYEYLKDRLGIQVSLKTFKRYLQAQDTNKSGRKGKSGEVKKVKAAPIGESKIPVPETEQEKPAEEKDESTPATDLQEETHSSSVPQPPALPPQVEKERGVGVAAYDPTEEIY